MKKLIFLVIVLLVLGIGAYILFSAMSKPSSQSTPNQTSASETNTTDLSPSVPNSQKTVVTIRMEDSSVEKFIMAQDMVSDYIKNLPSSQRVISQSPAPQ